MRVFGSLRAMAGAAVLLCGVAVADPGPSPAAVVAAEREFDDDAQARGWAATFKKYAAADAVVFQPDPVNAQASLADQPDEPADRSLKWWPVWAGIAVSSDLGFTTGPYTVGDKGFGHYFTVWVKQSDGTWRWIYDGGPRNEAKSPLGPETEPARLPIASVESGSPEVAWADVAATEALLANTAQQDAKAAYLAHLSNDARIMGSPAQPAVGSSAIGAELDRRAKIMVFKVLGGRSSAAGDLVFTYGDAHWSREGELRRGHYVRVWQKRGEGWKLVFDELLGLPPKKPAQ